MPLRRFGLPALIVAVTFAIQAKLIIHDPLLARDDHYLVDALRGISSPVDYYQALMAGKVVDLQPVRDLSFAFNLLLEHVFGFGAYHLTNWLIWLGILWSVYEILKILKLSPQSIWVAVGLYSVHPLFIGSISWVSARKHLLAALFIFLATREFLKKGSRFRICAFYVLSTLSHPIFLLWPLWAGLYAWVEKDKRRDFWACIPWMLVIAVLNQIYYRTLYISATGFTKLADVADSETGFALLGLGRYFSNLLFPARLVVSYNPGSTLNLVGLILLPLMCYASGKFLGWRRTLQWAAFFFFPLVVVTFMLTNLFIADTYALGAALGWFVLLAMALEHVSRKVLIYSFASVIAVILAARSVVQAQSWESDAALWVHSYETEPNFVSIRNMTNIALQQGNAEVALQLIHQLKEEDPYNRAIGGLLGRAIMTSKTMTTEQKIEWMKKEKPAEQDPDGIYNSVLSQLIKTECENCDHSPLPSDCTAYCK